ncbi:MAG: hypothetical protein ACK4RV_10295 [Caulobacter sp.]
MTPILQAIPPRVAPMACFPPWHRITTRDMDAMAFVFVATEAGCTDVAAATVRQIEDRIGVRDYDRLPDAVKVERHIRRRAELTRNASEVRERVRKTRPVEAFSPDSETKRLLREALTASQQADEAEEQARRLKGAGFQRQADACLAQALSARKEAVRMEVEAADRIKAQTQARWSQSALSEREALEVARGGEVVEILADVPSWVRDERGAMVRGTDGLPILGHDKAVTRRVESSRGLMMALEKGDLEGQKAPPEQLWHVGTQYRDAYEIAAALVSPSRDPGQPATIQGRRPMGLHDYVLDAFLSLRRMRGQPVAYDLYGSPKSDRALTPLTDLQREVLDRVCGQDMTIRATAKAIRRRHGTVKTALVTGLMTAKENLSSR